MHTKKMIEPEVVVKEPAVEEVIKEEPTKLDAAAEVVVEKVEAVVQKAADITDLPLRFGAVRTDEQNKSFYKSKDLRKKSKPQEEAADAKEEVKVEPEHVEAVVEMIQEKRPQRQEGNRRPEGRRGNGRPSADRTNRGGERRSRNLKQGESVPEGKVVPMKPRREEPPKQEAAKVETVTPAEAKSEAVAAKKEAPVKKNAAAAPAKKASGQNNPGFFGRMFGKKKNKL